MLFTVLLVLHSFNYTVDTTDLINHVKTYHEQEDLLYKDIDTIFKQCFDGTTVYTRPYRYRNINGQCLPLANKHSQETLEKKSTCTDEMLTNLIQAEINLEQFQAQGIANLQIFAEHNIDFNAQDSLGKTPLDYALTNKMSQALRSYGASKCSYATFLNLHTMSTGEILFNSTIATIFTAAIMYNILYPNTNSTQTLPAKSRSERRRRYTSNNRPSISISLGSSSDLYKSYTDCIVNC